MKSWSFIAFQKKQKRKHKLQATSREKNIIRSRYMMIDLAANADGPLPETLLNALILFKLTYSFLASKEVALPSEVQESLLSQSCDAKEVVLQVGKTMQLDQSSLEQLEPETKKLIRCFARKAIDANRLDVFEHLREITPAGTTGESVIGQGFCYRFHTDNCFYYSSMDL